MPKPVRRSLLRRLAAAGVLALGACFASPLAHAAVPGTYEIVDLGGQSYVTTAMVFTPDGIRAAIPGGVVKTLPSASVDWYETFYRNIKAGATNVVVFRAGSLLRFDRFELKDGDVLLTVGGAQVRMAESLIDFERSVREGAMVKLPETAGATVQVSRSTGGAWSDDGSGGAPDDPGPAASRRRGARVSPARRGALGQPPAAPEDGTTAMPEEMPQEEPGPMEMQQPDGTADPGAPGGGSSFGRSPFPRQRGGLDRDKPAPGSPSGTDGQSSGQAVVTISTDYSGPIGGLQVLLQYPPSLQVVEPVSFTGFAGNWMATPNTTVSGQINIGGIAQPGTSVSGGEFLRVTFVWTGTPPSRQLFRISQLSATGEMSETLSDFRTTMDVQISP